MAGAAQTCDPGHRRRNPNVRVASPEGRPKTRAPCSRAVLQGLPSVLVFRSSRQSGEAARADLEAYLVAHVDNGAELCCPRRAPGEWGQGCATEVTSGRVFAPGQLSYVGSHYVLNDALGPLRILVIGMQTGEDRSHTTMKFRAGQVLGAAAQSQRDSTRHMDATAAALGVLLGVDPHDDTVVVDDSPVHLFNCFALANASLCSAAKPGAGIDPLVGRGGSPPDIFYKNCRPHLQATIAALRPTVVIVQGRRKSGWSPSRALEDVARCTTVDGDDQLVRAELRYEDGAATHRFVATLFPHPGVKDERSWQAGWGSRYFKTEVAPRLRSARRLAASESP